MSLIVEENLVSFKTLEKEIFKYVCELGCQMTKYMLESHDEELMKGRDTRKYKNKGLRQTTIKTVYGDVEYSRRIYETHNEDGNLTTHYLDIF